MAEKINRLNKITVLNIVRDEKEISRAEIVKISGLSAPTVTRIVDSLIHKERLLVDAGMGESSGGRPPLLVGFNGTGNFVIGIDWGRTHIHGIVSNLNAETVWSIDIPVSAEGNFVNDLSKVRVLIRELIDHSGVDENKILGIGMAVAGFVNHKTGIVEFSPNFGWKNIHVKNEFQDSFNIPVFVDNVSRLMALGELSYGLGDKIKDFVFINIGYGIGSGIILDGKPVYGYDGFAGEVGHTRIHINKPGGSRICVCGKSDCLECYASGRGILETAMENLDLNKQSLLWKEYNKDKEKISTEIISGLAKEGDEFCKKIMEDAAEILAVSFANYANIVNPGAIILGGKVTGAGDFFFEKIREVFQNESLKNVSRPVRILKSGILGEAGVKGAIALILKEVLELNVTKT